MTATHARWYPCAVTLPGQHKPWSRCYVLVADDGLHVFRRRSESADWHSPVNWSATTLPESERQARNGVDVHTTGGLVVVTVGSGCRCGAMGSWAGPSWSRVERVRT